MGGATDAERSLPNEADLTVKARNRNLRRLYFSVGIATCFMIGELIGGLISGSLAILTDAAHILSDILGFCISIVSLHITRRPVSTSMSYGFYRAEVLGALASIVLIWGLMVWLVSESIIRLVEPTPVDGLIMIIIGAGGLAANIFMGVCLEADLLSNNSDQAKANAVAAPEEEGMQGEGENQEKEKKKVRSLNMRAAFLHVLGDGLQSVGVVIAGIVIYYEPDYMQADPACTLLFSIIVFSTTFPIVKDCMRILMEGSPKEIDVKEVTETLTSVKNI